MGSSDKKFKTRSLVINMNGVLAYKSLPIKKRYFATPDSTTSSCNANPCSTTMKRHLSRAVPETPKRTSFNYSLEASDNGSFDSGSVSPISLKCPKCPKMFGSENALKIHHRRHLNKQSGRYKCKLCGQTFSQRSGQVSHSRVHTREKPYNCDQCPKRFADFSTFTKHKRVHTGDKPYSCSLCHRNFSQSGNLHRHVRVIHFKKSH